MKIDSKAIKELADLLDETGLNEIEVADGDKAIRVSKGGGTVVAAGAAPVSMASDPAVPQVANTSAPDTVAHTHPGAVTSPMVGTAYLQGEPGAPPFVKKGDTVAAGDTVMITHGRFEAGKTAIVSADGQRYEVDNARLFEMLERFRSRLEALEDALVSKDALLDQFADLNKATKQIQGTFTTFNFLYADRSDYFSGK